MDPIDIRDMVERAKADASAARALRKGPNEGLDSLLDEVGDVPPEAGKSETLVSEIDTMVEQAEKEEKVAAVALLERGRLMKIAKVLASLDVISEVRS